MKDISNGPDQQMRCNFFQTTGKRGIYFSTDQARPATKKGRQIILHVNPSRHNKDEVFKLAAMDKRINVNVQIKCVFCFHYRNINKNLLIILLLFHVFHNLHAVCSFHNSDLLICFEKGYGCLCLDWI